MEQTQQTIKKYFSSANEIPKIINKVGNGFEPIFEEKTDKEGHTELKQVDTKNIYELIQEAREGVELSQLIEKYRPKIDEFDLTKMEESIQDLSEMPDNLIDAYNLINQTKKTFEEMPSSIKNEFNNNYLAFIAGSANGTLESVIKKHKDEEQIKGQISIDDLQQPKAEENKNE